MDTLGAKTRARLRREAINDLLAQGHSPDTVLRAFGERDDLRALVDGDVGRTIRRDISRVQAERAGDPNETARADHVRDLRRTLAQCEALVDQLTGSDKRLMLQEIAAVKRDLIRLETPQYAAPLGRPAGQRRTKAGQRRSKAGAAPARDPDPDAADDAPWRREGRPATAAEALAYDPLPPEPDEDPEGYRSWQDKVLNDGEDFEPEHADGCGCPEVELSGPCPARV